MELIRHKNKWYIKSATGYREVLATTDKSLTTSDKDNCDEFEYIPIYLPQPSESFIKGYCDNPVDEILVEYTGTEWYNERFGGTWQPFPDHQATLKRNIPIVNSDNTINIHSVKSSWNREEVEELCRKAIKQNDIESESDFQDWISNKL